MAQIDAVHEPTSPVTAPSIMRVAIDVLLGMVSLDVYRVSFRVTSRFEVLPVVADLTISIDIRNRYEWQLIRTSYGQN